MDYAPYIEDYAPVVDYSPVATLDPNILIVTLAIAAIFAPIFVALINNHHQRRTRDMELQYQYYEQKTKHIEQTFETLLTNYGQMSGDGTSENIANFKESYFKALPYIQEQSHKISFDIFYHNASSQNYMHSDSDIKESIIPAISKILSQYKIEANNNCFTCRLRKVRAILRKERQPHTSTLEKPK